MKQQRLLKEKLKFKYKSKFFIVEWSKYILWKRYNEANNKKTLSQVFSAGKPGTFTAIFGSK